MNSKKITCNRLCAAARDLAAARRERTEGSNLSLAIATSSDFSCKETFAFSKLKSFSLSLSFKTSNSSIQCKYCLRTCGQKVQPFTILKEKRQSYEVALKSHLVILVYVNRKPRVKNVNIMSLPSVEKYCQHLHACIKRSCLKDYRKNLNPHFTHTKLSN